MDLWTDIRMFDYRQHFYRQRDGWMKERDGWLEDGWTCRSVDGWMDEQIKTKLCTGFLSD